MKNIRKHKIFRTSCSIAVFVAMLFVQSLSVASETGKFGFGLGFLSGGEKLATATLVNTQTGDPTTSSVTSGGGINIWMGYLIPISDNIDTLISLGYIVDDITAENGSIKFDRYALDVIPQYRFDNIRIGAGATYHTNTTFAVSGFENGGEVEFEDTLGTVFVASIKVERLGTIEIRRTMIDYTPSPVNGTPVVGNDLEASNWGIFLSGYF